MPEQHPNLPNAVEACFLLLALFMLEYLIGAAMYDMRNVLGLTEMQQASLIVVLANGVLFSVLMHYKNLGYRQLFHPSTSSPKVTFLLLLPSILFTLPALLFVMSVVQFFLLMLFPMSQSEQQMFETMGASNLAAVLTVCVLAPLMEEMLFRGIILRSFLHQYRLWPAIIGSAVLFGAAHGNVYQFVTALVLGTYCGWLYQRTQSLIPAITVHAGNNIGASILPLDHPGQEGAWLNDGTHLLWLGILALGALGMWWQVRLLARR